MKEMFERDQAVLIIAEIGVNHNGNPETAMQLIDAAVAAGADAVKLQAFNPDEMILKGTAKVPYQKSSGAPDEDQYQLLQRLTLTAEAIATLLKRAKEKQIALIASVFDLSSAKLMCDLEMEMLKIPSGELTNLPLIEAVAGYGKPVIISTGMATLGETEEAVNAIGQGGKVPVALLHCVSSYPAPFDSLNLRVINTLEAAFGLPVGFSDHTAGCEAAVAAVALGARIIEKHFTLDRGLPGPDHQASLTPAEFHQFVASIRRTETALGNGIKGVTAVEQATRQLTRKSVVAKVDIPAHSIIEAAHLTVKRPGTGISPKWWGEIVGCRTLRSISQDTMIQWSDLITEIREENRDA